MHIPIRQWSRITRPDLNPFSAYVIARQYANSGRLRHKRDSFGRIFVNSREKWPMLLPAGRKCKEVTND